MAKMRPGYAHGVVGRDRPIWLFWGRYRYFQNF